MNLPGKIANELLSVLNDELQPAPVQRPSGISDITHIVATFPYAAPPADSNGQYLVTGMIKSNMYNLVSPEAPGIESLYEFNASYDNGSMTMNWTPYPDKEKLEVAEDTMDISLYIGDSLIREAKGRRMFDYSWLYGAIKYKARVAQDGVVVDTYETGNDSETVEIYLNDDSAIEVCGWYGYENSDKTSNEVCTRFRTPKAPEPEPTPTVAPTPEPTPVPTPVTPAEPQETANTEG